MVTACEAQWHLRCQSLKVWSCFLKGELPKSERFENSILCVGAARSLPHCQIWWHFRQPSEGSPSPSNLIQSGLRAGCFLMWQSQNVHAHYRRCRQLPSRCVP